MIATFVRFDILNFVTPAKRILPALLVVLLVSVTSPWPATAIGGAAIVMSLLAANPFATDERGRLDTLYATLPISRRAVVLGRYLALVALYVVLALLGTIVSVVVPLLRREPVGGEIILLVNAGSLVVFIAALAVQLPFFFSVGYTRARPLVFLPMAVVVALAWLAGQTGLLANVDFRPLLSMNPLVLCAFGVGVSALLVVISATISSVRYGRRSL